MVQTRSIITVVAAMILLVLLIFLVRSLYAGQRINIQSRHADIVCHSRHGNDEITVIDDIDSQSKVMQRVFENVYDKNGWGVAGGGSGIGSTHRATESARIVLELVVLKYGILSMLDAPCGSMSWMPLALTRIVEMAPCFDYLGADIARPIVEGEKSEASHLIFGARSQLLPRQYS